MERIREFHDISHISAHLLRYHRWPDLLWHSLATPEAAGVCSRGDGLRGTRKAVNGFRPYFEQETFTRHCLNFAPAQSADIQFQHAVYHVLFFACLFSPARAHQQTDGGAVRLRLKQFGYPPHCAVCAPEWGYGIDR